MDADAYLIISTILLSGIACIVIPLLSSGQKWAGAFVFILLNTIITSVAALKALLGQSTVISFY